MSPWVVISIPRPQAKFRLFCFPYAGAGAVVYRSWPENFSNDVEVCPVQLPGRGSRLREPLPATLTELAAEAAAGLRPLLDRPFAFFGYSLGSLVAFELARALRRAGLPQPMHLFVAARMAPQVPPMSGVPRHDMPLDNLLTALEAYYGRGIDPRLLRDPDMAALLTQIIRADLCLIETYSYTNDPPLSCPISAYAGDDDRSTSETGMLGWREQTTSSFALHVFPCVGHFFLDDRRNDLVKSVSRAFAKDP